jgi:restriction system protein
MSIWRYADRVLEIANIKSALAASECPFCRSGLELLREDIHGGSLSPRFNSIEKLWACPICGWWKGHRTSSTSNRDFRRSNEWGAAASLQQLNLKDLSLPIEEVRAYLAAKYEARFDLHPRLLELVVASVFRDHGYLAETTAYSNDGGIDVVLRGKDEERIGVQVKRYRKSIEVEQIRSFAGALLLKGLTKGVFVTTSTFQRGAGEASATAASMGYSIELQDATKFLDSLRIAQREMYESAQDLKREIPREGFVLIAEMDSSLKP